MWNHASFDCLILAPRTDFAATRCQWWAAVSVTRTRLTVVGSSISLGEPDDRCQPGVDGDDLNESLAFLYVAASLMVGPSYRNANQFEIVGLTIRLD
jgi:hypothetical protein